MKKISLVLGSLLLACSVNASELSVSFETCKLGSGGFIHKHSVKIQGQEVEIRNAKNEIVLQETFLDLKLLDKGSEELEEAKFGFSNYFGPSTDNVISGRLTETGELRFLMGELLDGDVVLLHGRSGENIFRTGFLNEDGSCS